MSVTVHNASAQQLLESPPPGRWELLRGELVMMAPAGFEHGRIVSRINARLQDFVERHNLGVVTGAETGFQIESDPDTVRAPDVGFVRADRVPPTPPIGFFPGAPDLAVEVLSPYDRATEVTAKVQDWLAVGCCLVWVVDPSTRTVTVYDAQETARVLAERDDLNGGEVLCDFRVTVAELFALAVPPTNDS
jgi:Uma2 family endonuclease